MEVRFTVTLEDYIAFNLHTVRKAGSGRTAYLAMWLGIPVIFVALAVSMWPFESGAAVLLAIGHAFVAVLFLCIYPALARAAVERNVRAQAKKMDTRGIVGEITLIFSEESLVEITEAARTEVRWEHMKCVDVVGDYTYIFVTGVSASILPRHGFDSAAEYESARDFALRKLAERAGE